MNLFEYVYPRFYFDKSKPLRLFEAFSGIGTQASALKKLGVNLDHVGISEIDKYAIASYKAIHGDVKNYGDICKINGRDLPQIDIFTYSFPCTDLSKAGQQAGMEKGTRSGLVWEVIRILKEMPNKPKVLLMENVVDLVQVKFVDGFNELQAILTELGYQNWNETLNARHYGVAQNRDRIFMVSILGDYSYTFPNKVALQNKLLDCLEENVDEKYFLSQKMIDCFTDMTDRNGYIRGEIFKPHIDLENVKYAYAITTRAGGRPTDNFIAIPEATLKGYAKAYEGDGVYINRPHQKRGVVQKGMIPTLKTSGNDIGVVVKDTRNLKQKLCDALIENKVVKNGDVINHSYTNSKTRPNLVDFIESGDGIMPTLTTRPDIFGVVVSDDDELLAIRKLTPRECWRLMGMSDEDFDKAQAVPMSNAQLYKQAGNAIVVDVLEAIFKNLFNESKQL